MHHYFWLADKSPGTALADFLEARFWIVSGLPTIHPECIGTMYSGTSTMWAAICHEGSCGAALGDD